MGNTKFIFIYLLCIKLFFFNHRNDVIPIVLGAASWEYKNALPSHSYIDVDDFETPRDLAQYLQKLDENDDLYNEYFRWKSYGDFVASKPWCRVCSLLHEPALPAIWYDDVDAWWRSKDTCIDRKTKWSSVLDKWGFHVYLFIIPCAKTFILLFTVKILILLPNVITVFPLMIWSFHAVVRFSVSNAVNIVSDASFSLREGCLK